MSQNMTQNNQNNRYQQAPANRVNGQNQYNQYVQANRPGQQNLRSARNVAPGVRPAQNQQRAQNPQRIQSMQNGAPQRRPVKRKKKGPSLGLIALLLIVLGVIIVIFASILGGSSSSGDSGNVTTDPVETTAPDTTADDTTEADTTEPETTEAPIAEPKYPEITFKADLTDYEKYFEPENLEEYTFLLSAKNPLDKTYKPSDLTALVDTRKDGRATQYMREYAAKSLEAMLIEARANGCVGISATSGYRSFEYQTQLFNNEVSYYSSSMSYEEACKKAATFVAVPGTSEHQSGLCVDIHNISTGASVVFANTPEGAWLAENCWKFGFILRYPQDKTEITGITFEPWHFRYVGRSTAYEIHSAGICLEEYHQQINGEA